MTKTILAIIVVLGVGFGVRELFPKKIHDPPPIPRIVTHYDTIPALPKWYEDSVRYWKKRKYTTDTVNLLIAGTLVNQPVIPVNKPPEERPNLWPLLRYSGHSRFGDTASVTTFSVRSGQLYFSKIFVPGILIGIDASDTLQTPRINFVPFPVCPGPSFLYKVKMIGIGGGLGYVAGRIF